MTRRAAVALALLAIPGAASADGTSAVLPWGEGAATAEEVRAVADAAVEIVQGVTGAAPVRMDESGPFAAACGDVDCIAGLAALAGATRVLTVAVVPPAGATPAVVRFVLVEVGPPSREVVRIETGGTVAEWRPVLESALRPLVGAPPVVETTRVTTGSLVVSTLPTGATVYLDGVILGRTPLQPLPAVAPGRHVLTATLEGFAPRRQEIFVAVGEELRTLITLTRAPFEQSERPPAPVERERRERWYGWQILIADAAAIALGGVTQSPWGWVVGYLGGPLAVHLANGNSAGAGLSIGMRFVSPFVGAGLGFALGGGDDDLVGLFAVSGLLTGIILDVALVARVPEGPERE